MPSLLEYFNNDFKELSLDRTIPITIQNLDKNKEVISVQNLEIKERTRQDLNNSIRFFTYFIPNAPDTLGIIGSVIDNLQEQIKQLEGMVAIGSFSGDKLVGQHMITYSNRIYFYTENLLGDEDIQRLDEYCKLKGVFVTVRSSDYVKKRMDTEKPFAFISHDSRDKELIAKKLAYGLNSRLCFVWYDEYSLKIGDSLRESIEKGIKEAKKCILVLTTNYLNNPGWGKKEFDSIFTRELIKKEKIVLPIWFGVTKDEVYEYSPSLADTFALTWPSSENKSDEEYKQEVEQLISKIHTAITANTASVGT
jgi:TIR domain